MSTHFLQVTTAPFDAIISGDKTIESRLFDDKRQLVQPGDAVEFINREAPEQKVLFG